MQHKITRKAADVNDRSSPPREKERERERERERFNIMSVRNYVAVKITRAEKRLAIERKRGIVN
jgi:hypothetical protein